VAEIEAKVLSAREAHRVPEIFARAMRDNPIHVAAYGWDDAKREASLLRVYGAVIPMQRAKGTEILGAFSDGQLVGVSAAAPPGACKPAGSENLRMLFPVLRAAALSGTLRVVRWFRS